MPTYAVLGSTGNTGQSLLRILMQNSSNKINAYCRSKSKLERLSPEIVSNPNVRVFEGSLNDQAIIHDCIKDTYAVFMAVAVSGNIPGNTIAQDASRVVIEALREIRNTDSSPKLPNVIVLSSAAIDPIFNQSVPSLGLAILLRAESNIYNDLIAAEEILRREKDWLSVIFMRPGALTIDSQKGHALTFEPPKGVVSFMDLAAAMVEVAESGDVHTWKGLSVNPTASDVRFPWNNVPSLFKGLIIHFFPQMYHWIGC